MFKRNFRGRAVAWAAILALPLTPVTVARSQGVYDNNSLHGEFVFSFDGAFVSAPPPFSGDVLQLQAAEVGLLTFDGTGTVWGETSISFHHPAVPLAALSRKALRGNYVVTPNGHTLIELDEFSLDSNGDPLPVRSNSFVIECYIVQRQKLAECLLHSLVSYQQGPEPRTLPTTMAGTLRRQH